MSTTTHTSSPPVPLTVSEFLLERHKAERVVTVTEFSARAMPMRVSDDEWWVVLTAVDGTEVEIPGELVDSQYATEPDRCDYVGDHGETGCGNYADPATDSGRCGLHRSDRWAG